MEAGRKPVGGIASVELVAAADVVAVECTARGLPTALAYDAGTRTTTCALLESGSSYTEQAVARDGLIAVRHTLKLALSPDEDPRIAEEMLRRIDGGVVALVTACDASRRLVGWSRRLGLEQPLRPSGATTATGARPLEAPVAELTLESEDDVPAPLLDDRFTLIQTEES